MAIDKILGNGALDQVADSVFSAVSDSVSEIKAMQKRKAAENVQVVIQALKKIESDLQDKYDGVTTVLEKRVASIKDGRDGQNGVDGRAGKDGRPGRDGAVGPRGANGVDGRNGRDGVDGVSVVNANIDFDGSLIISLSNGRTINVGEVVAPDLAERIKVITNGGGTSQGVLDTLTSLQNQINALVSLGAVTYEGTWNASTNTPTIVAGTGNKGEYYVVSVAGNTSIDGETLWGVGDWIIFNGAVWQKVDGGSTGNFTDLTTSGTVTHNGGTANGVAYLNGSKVLTTGSALTFTGSNLGVGIATALQRLHVYESTAATGAFLQTQEVGGQNAYFGVNTSGGSIQVTGANPLQFSINGSEQMRLTSTGLGIGTSSPANPTGGKGIELSNASGASLRLTNSATYLDFQSGGSANYILSNGAYPLLFYTNGTERLRLDASGNLGLGVTPSATVTKSIQVGPSAGFTGDGVTYGWTAAMSQNAYMFGNNTWKYIGSITAALYLQDGNVHKWYNAPSGTLGDTISFTQAMTLDASGNLGVGTTGPTVRFQTSTARSATLTSASFGTSGTGAVNDFNKLTLYVQNTLGGSTGGAAIGAVLEALASNQTALAFYTDGGLGSQTERARITSGGVLDIGTGAGAVGQIQFPATQVASANANTLDDYEEGTWTPVLGGTATYTTQIGTYQKIGRTVICHFQLVVNLIGTGSTSTVGGLPFSSGIGPNGAGCLGNVYSLATSFSYVNYYVNATTLVFNGIAAGGGTSVSGAAFFGNSTSISGTAVYAV